jgi:hypothetical protein
LDESDYKSFNAILNNWKSYKNQQSMEMGLWIKDKL